MRCIIICCVYIHCTSTCMNIIIHMSVCHSDTFDIHMTYVFLEKFFSAIAGWSYGTSVQAQIKWWNCVIASRSIWAPSTYLMYQNISKEHPYHLKSLFLFFHWDIPSSLSPRNQRFQWNMSSLGSFLDFEGSHFPLLSLLEEQTNGTSDFSIVFFWKWWIFHSVLDLQKVDMSQCQWFL